MYKDKAKQREAQRERQRRYRRDKKGVTSQGVTVKGVTGIDKALIIVRDELDQDNELMDKVAKSGVLCPIRTVQGNIRVSKSGDADYVPQCENMTPQDMIEDVSKHGGEYSFKTVKGQVQDIHRTEPKRGFGIKCFEDLPLDVQQTIRTVSSTNEEFQRRTAIAIAYQHTFPFPERY